MAKPVKRRKQESKAEKLKRLYHYKQSVGDRTTLTELRKKYKGKRVTGSAFRVRDSKGRFIANKKAEAVEYIVKQHRKQGKRVDIDAIVERAKNEKILVTVAGINEPFHTELTKKARGLVAKNEAMTIAITKNGHTKKYRMDKVGESAEAYQEINDNMNDIYRVYNDMKVDFPDLSPLFQVIAEEQYELGDDEKEPVYYSIDFDAIKHDRSGDQHKQIFDDYKNKSRFRRK